MAETSYTKFLASLELQSHDLNGDQQSGKHIWDYYLHGNREGFHRMFLEEGFLEFVVHQFDEDVSDAASSDEDVVGEVQREVIRKMRKRVRTKSAHPNCRQHHGKQEFSLEGPNQDAQSEDSPHQDRSEGASKKRINPSQSDVDLDSIEVADHQNGQDGSLLQTCERPIILMTPYEKYCNRIRGEKDRLYRIKEESLSKYEELKAQYKDFHTPSNIFDGCGYLPRPDRQMKQEYFFHWGTTCHEAKEFLAFAKRSRNTRLWLEQPNYHQLDRLGSDLMYLVLMPFYIHRRVRFMIETWSSLNLGPIPDGVRASLAHMSYFRPELVFYKERREIWLWYLRVADYVNQTYQWPFEPQIKQLLDNADSELNEHHLVSCKNLSCRLASRNNLGRQTWQTAGREFVVDYTNGAPFELLGDLIRFALLASCGYVYSFVAERTFGFGFWQN